VEIEEDGIGLVPVVQIDRLLAVAGRGDHLDVGQESQVKH